jgi:hypothetical protein
VTFDEFELSAGRLRTLYGEKAFPRERIEIIFRAVQYSSSKVWDEALNLIIGEHMHAPSLTKIKEALYAVRKTHGETTDAWEPIRDRIKATEKLPADQNCGQCFGSGVLMAHRRADERKYLYCFGCSCPAGDEAMRLPENKSKIRQWDMSHRIDWRQEYEPETPRRPASRQDARLAVSKLFVGHDLNVALGDKPAPKRRMNQDDYDLEK